MFERAYESVLHHPGVAWVATAALLLWLFRAKASRFFTAFLLVFAVEIALDAFFTSPTEPAKVAANDTLHTGIEIAFVIIGDFRFFVLVERFASPKSAPPSSLGPVLPYLRAVVWAFVVPLTWTALYKAHTIEMPDEYVKFLVYELLFMALAFVLRFAVLPWRLKDTAPAPRRYLIGLATYELGQYSLWALADILILWGMREVGFLLRIVPNVMYYGGFLLFSWRFAPKDLRAASGRS